MLQTTLVLVLVAGLIYRIANTSDWSAFDAGLLYLRSPAGHPDGWIRAQELVRARSGARAVWAAENDARSLACESRRLSMREMANQRLLVTDPPIGVTRAPLPDWVTWLALGGIVLLGMAVRLLRLDDLSLVG
ncbi:MAG: hypothetical protein R2855_13535 [Thermomicrobiales bacterium]